MTRQSEMEGKCFMQKDIFPFIEEVIEDLCIQSGKASHAAIVLELLKHTQASAIVERAIKRCPKFDPEWMAGNMVDWLSAYYGTRKDLIDFHLRFRREKENDCWTYIRRRS